MNCVSEGDCVDMDSKSEYNGIRPEVVDSKNCEGINSGGIEVPVVKSVAIAIVTPRLVPTWLDILWV